jgi:hypothetical protein
MEDGKEKRLFLFVQRLKAQRISGWWAGLGGVLFCIYPSTILVYNQPFFWL